MPEPEWFTRLLDAEHERLKAEGRTIAPPPPPAPKYELSPDEAEALTADGRDFIRRRFEKAEHYSGRRGAMCSIM